MFLFAGQQAQEKRATYTRQLLGEKSSTSEGSSFNIYIYIYIYTHVATERDRERERETERERESEREREGDNYIDMIYTYILCL